MTDTDATARETLVNRLFRIPAKASAAVLIALTVLGLALGGWAGAVLAGLVVLALLGMIALMWVDLQPVERMMRISVLVLLLAVVIVRTVGTV